MTNQILIVFGVLIGAIALFAWGRIRVDIVAILVMLALMLSHVLTPDEALAGFGNPAVILIAAIFIVREGLVNTGVAHRLGEGVMKLGGGNETRLVVLIMLLAGGVGAFMSSSAIVAMLIPVVLTISKKAGLNSKRMLMPLSVAALISGMMTLIASSPNMIIEDALKSRGLAALGFFSFTPFGLAVLAAGIAFMLVARRVLSKQTVAEDAGAKSPSSYDLIGYYGLADHWHRLRVPVDSPLINRAVAQRRDLYDQFGVILVGFEKHPRGKVEFSAALPETVFEVMLAPESKLIGKTLGELEFRSRYHLAVLAVRHRGESLTKNLADQELDFGDTLLVAGSWAEIGLLRDDRENFLVLTLPAEYSERLPARKLAPVAVGIVVVMVAVMAFELAPNSAAALLAALAMIASGCVGVESIYRVVSWKTVVLIAGMLPLATALTKTGATALMANGMVTALGSLGPLTMLAVLFFVTALVGLFLSNSATAVLIAPIAIDAAESLHVSPRAFAMTVAIACCAAFVTPVSSPVNMLVMEPGGYAFGDYVKVGLPLLALTMLVTVALVAAIYGL